MDPAAVLALDRDLGIVSLGRVVAVRLTRGRRRNRLWRLVQSQTAQVATEHVDAIQLPDVLGRRVEMADAKIAVRDHHGLIRSLERGQQEIRGFGHGSVVSAHRPILMPVERPSRLDPGGDAPCWRAFRSKGVKKVVRSGGARPEIILKSPLTSCEVADWDHADGADEAACARGRARAEK
jgi:hypothetical protein